MDAQLMAIVAEGKGGRLYLSPSKEHETITKEVKPERGLETELSTHPQYMAAPRYGLRRHQDLFTSRQLIALTTFSDLVSEAYALVLAHSDNDTAYTEAVETYLALAVDKAVDRNTTLCAWESGMDRMRNTFTRQALSMVWDYVETNPFANAGGDLQGTVQSLCEVLDKLGWGLPGLAQQLDAIAIANSDTPLLFSTDPPYYDNVPYADLSDVFYVWLRRSLSRIYPDLFSTLLVPKSQELVADQIRHGSRQKAQRFFEEGLGRAFVRMRVAQHPNYPLTVYYAFRQTESDEDSNKQSNGMASASTGWETMLEGLLKAGFAITGTWPMRTELGSRTRGLDSNALASSIILVCRPPARRCTAHYPARPPQCVQA